MGGRRRTSVRALLVITLLFLLLAAMGWWLRGHPGFGSAARAGSGPDGVPSVPASGRATPSVPPRTRPPNPQPTLLASPVPSPVPSVRTSLPATATAALARLSIGPRDSAVGYSRLLFGPGWLDPDGNGCDARNDVLRRDLSGVVLRPRTNGCIVERGTLHDPYTGASFAFERGPATSGEVQIDHVVSLGNAWRTGAQGWTTAQRVAFANDPLELLAVLKQTNTDKDGADAASWLPPKQQLRCAFVARQVAVKFAYRLWVTQAEHDAMAAVLAGCPGQRLPTR